MKRTLLAAVAAVSGIAAYGQALADGYYRVQNTRTQRWALLADDKAYVDKQVAGESAVNLEAIRTYRNFDRVVSEPGSVIKFIYNRSAAGYTLAAQGTDTHTMLQSHGSYYLSVRQSGRSYIASAYAQGFNIHLSDEDFDDPSTGYIERYDSLGYMLPTGRNTQYWFITPVSASTDNYFGFRPTLSVGGKYYLPFYASFGFTKYSEGIKAYYVNRVNEGGGVAELREITSDVFPAGVPMIIETSGASPSDNRVNIVDGGTAPAGNLLHGVYFCSAAELLPRYDRPTKDHEAYTLNNPATMRLLGEENGRLVLKKSTAKYIPANSFYLSVSEDCPDVLRLVGADEFVAGVNRVSVSATPADGKVFSIDGRCVSTTGLSGLASGIYISNGKKVVVK